MAPAPSKVGLAPPPSTTGAFVAPPKKAAPAPSTGTDDLLNFDAPHAPSSSNGLGDIFGSAPADDGFSDFQANN
jgi:hypothetical protein